MSITSEQLVEFSALIETCRAASDHNALADVAMDLLAELTEARQTIRAKTADVEFAMRNARIAIERRKRADADLDALRDHLADPIVRAVADLVAARDQEYRRAEFAHELKDQANRRWVDVVVRHEGDGQ